MELPRGTATAHGYSRKEDEACNRATKLVVERRNWLSPRGVVPDQLNQVEAIGDRALPPDSHVPPPLIVHAVVTGSSSLAGGHCLL